MGALFSNLFNFKVNKRVLMLGIDGAGKTTILYKLKLGEVRTTIPTIGFNVESIEYKKLSLTVWDVGGQDRIRPLWKHYYEGVNAMIFVVDVNDIDRMNEVIQELKLLINEDHLLRLPYLIYANKIDLPNQINMVQFNNELYKIMAKNNYHIQKCSAVKGEGLYEGLEWLNTELLKKK